MGAQKLLTLATSANSEIIDGLDFAKLNPLVDWYNIMTYDFTSGSWGDNITGHHSKTMKS
jgi:GH18 family chitinase